MFFPLMHKKATIIKFCRTQLELYINIDNENVLIIEIEYFWMKNESNDS